MTHPAISIQRPMTGAEWSLLIVLSILWGGSFFFIEIALTAVPVMSVVLARVVLAACILWGVMRVTGIAMPRDIRIWLAFVVMGLLNNAIPFTLIVWGQMHIASGVAAILNAATPLFSVVFAHFLTADEPMRARRLAGVVLGLVGVAVMLGGAASSALGPSVAAQIACLGAAVSYAFAGIFGRRFRTMGVAPLATATGQVTASSVLLAPLVLLVDRPWHFPMPEVPVIAAIVGLAALSTALAYVIYFRILATAGATNLLLVTLLVPVTAILLGVGFLDEKLLPRHLIGMGLIALGLAAIDGRIVVWVRQSVARRAE